MYNIYIDDLIGNAFVAYLMATNKRVLSLSKIEDFGNAVIKSLDEKGIEARLVLSRNMLWAFLFDCSLWFTYNSEKNEITLSNEITPEMLITRFSGYTAIPVISELRAEKNTKVLF